MRVIEYAFAHKCKLTEAVMSVRTADGHSMPQQYTEVQYDILKAYVSGGLMTGEIICYDCVSWPGGSLDISSATQPLIWANGPGEAVRSSSLNADIAMHQEHGHSQLNMAKHATTAEEANEDEGLVEPINEYGTPSGWPRGVKLLVYLHAWALGPMFVFMVPIAIMILRWPSNPSVRWHQMLQVLCAAIAVIGLLNTLSFSRQVPEWSSYGNFHQILGIFALVGLLCQAVLGWYNHRKFSLGERDRTQRTRSRLHIWAGRTILPLGMLNAVLGLRWAGKPGQAAMLVLIELFMLAGTAVIVWRWNRNAWRREKSGAMGAYGILNGGIEGTDVDEPFALHDIDEDDEDAEDDENDRKHHPSS